MAKKKFRKPHPSPPHWYWWDSDCCWDCSNRNNCGNCKRLKEVRDIERDRRARKEREILKRFCGYDK